MDARKTVSHKSDNIYDKSKKAILVVSYGTSSTDRENTIGAIETAIAAANEDYEVRRAFTSLTVIDIIRKKQAEETDNVEQALERLIKDGVKILVIQPTHITYSYQYISLIDAVQKYRSRFASLSIGKPLLADDDDYEMLANALIDEAAEYSDDETAVILIGHGINNQADSAYLKLQNTFTAKGRISFFVGTINTVPALGQILNSVKTGIYKKVILRPLMITSGIHVCRDVAGEKNSWKSAFEAEGFQVHCILEGLGAVKAVQDIYNAHASDAIDKLETL